MAKKREKHRSIRCPVCGSHAVIRDAKGICNNTPEGARVWVCSRYPQCDTYIRTQPWSSKPLGTMAGPKLRKLRWLTHLYLDQVCNIGLISRKDLYPWIAEITNTPEKYAHIGYMGEYYCARVIRACKEMLLEYGKQLPVIASAEEISAL